MTPRPVSRASEYLVRSAGADMSRRITLQRLWAILTGLTAIGGPSTLLSGCGGGSDEVAADATPPTPMPTLGAHDLVYAGLFDNVASKSTGLLATQVSGSTILVCVGRGTISQHVPPTDNMVGNAYQQHGTNHTYALWNTSGTALYACPSASGGGGHIISAANLPDVDDEVTLAVVEVKNGGVVKDFQHTEVTLASNNPVTSPKVTTTGPATLVAFWWGDADGSVPHDAAPNNGFTLIDSLFLPGNLVQCAVATKDVTAAGSYDVTWTTPPPTPPQGAQLWMVAVQSVP